MHMIERLSRRKNPIEYLNTDLVIKDGRRFDRLRAYLCEKGFYQLRYLLEKDGPTPKHWSGWFEIERDCKEPEAAIGEMLSVLEEMPSDVYSRWQGLRRKTFSVGYQYGELPPSFSLDLPSRLLLRMAKLDIRLESVWYHNKVLGVWRSAVKTIKSGWKYCYSLTLNSDDTYELSGLLNDRFDSLQSGIYTAVGDKKIVLRLDSYRHARAPFAFGRPDPGSFSFHFQNLEKIMMVNDQWSGVLQRDRSV